jgi:signal transduction histidine kinase
MRNRTWPVFFVGLGALLLLILLAGVAAVRQSSQMYDEIRAIQSAHEETQQSLFEIERAVFQISVRIRDYVLDTSAIADPLYRKQFEDLRSSTEHRLADLAAAAPPEQAQMFERLSEQLRLYFGTLDPVLEWPAPQRAAKGALFLREQQRPRRQSILAIANAIRALNAESYRARYQEINLSQLRSRGQLATAVGMAVLVGLLVAGATIYRISRLERQSDIQRRMTERVEHELRSLSSQLMRAQEEERRTISRELHDEVGQMLTALRIGLGTLDQVRSLPEDFYERLAEAKLLTEQTLRTVRDIAVGLRPSVLDLGLQPALQWQARQFSRVTGTVASVRINGQLPSLPDSYLTCIYRIVQEALTNSARHAQARNISVGVTATGAELELRIDDDGIGLREDWTLYRGLGLVGIEERAREIGGSVVIHSEPGKGVGIRVLLPMPEGVNA